MLLPLSSYEYGAERDRLEMNKLVRKNKDENILIELNTINTAKQIFDLVSSCAASIHG